MKVGDTVKVFDASLWRDCGYDFEDNSFFWRDATILEIYLYDSRGFKDLLADVRFHYDGRVSRGHFVNGINRNRQNSDNATPNDL